MSCNSFYFKFGDVTYLVGSKKLLDGVSFDLKSGEVVGILGRSGAGKSTLINVLTGDFSSCRVYGSILISSGIDHCLEIVEQIDHLWPFLTVMEHMVFNSLFTFGVLKYKIIYKIIKESGLFDQRDVQVGNYFVKGLSGGQKRRLSLASAIICRPKILVLDEPNSGLDGVSSDMVMNVVFSTSLEHSIGVLVTIHQPSQSLWNCFHNVLYLNKGRVAYFGQPTDLVLFTDSIGINLDPLNIDTSFLRCLDDNICDSYSVWCSGFFFSTVCSRDMVRWNYRRDGNDHVSFILKFLVLFRRLGIIVFRDVSFFFGRILLCFFLLFLNFLLFFNYMSFDQSNVITRLAFMQWSLCYIGLVSIMSVFSDYADWIIISGEIRCRRYVMNLFFLHILVWKFFWSLILTFFCVSFNFFILWNSPLEYFFSFIVIIWCCSFYCEILAGCCSVYFDNVVYSLFIWLTLYFSLLSFTGVSFSNESVNFFSKFIGYLSIFRPSFRCLVYFDLIDSSWSACGQCIFYGLDGSDVLDSIGSFMGPFRSHFVVNDIYFIAFNIIFIVLTFYVFMRKVSDYVGTLIEV